jgi:DNA ligase (NAD+)
VGIPNVGVTVARDIAQEHEKFSDLKGSAILRDVVANDSLKGRERKILRIKYESAKAVLEFFSSAYGTRFLERLHALGIDPASVKEPAPPSDGPLAGLGCVLTGALSRPRTEYAKLIELAGGNVQSAVSSKTRYLIAGENVGASKTRKAAELGVEVIGEARLKELLGGAVQSEAPLPLKELRDEPSLTQGELF